MFEPCEECARKHLAAALAYAHEASRDGCGNDYIALDSYLATVGRAYVLLTESEQSQYLLHKDLAVGYLVVAEEGFIGGSDGTRDVSNLRAARHACNTQEALHYLDTFLSEQFDLALMAGHLAEARREGAAVPPSARPDQFISGYAVIVNDAFDEKGGD